MPNLETSVTVIGAGPAGSITARTIARHGFDVVLVEKDEYPGETNVCAGGMPKSLIKETGLSSDVIEKEISGGRHFLPCGIKTSKLDHVTVYRPVFDKALASLALEEGAKLLTNTLVKDVLVKNDGIRVILEGTTDTIESKLVVFADGPNTLACRKFGIGFKPDMDKTIVSVACEVKWENNPLDHYEFYHGFEISPWGYGWIFPKRNTVNVGVGCLYGELRSNVIESLNFMLQRYPLTCDKLKGKEIAWLSSALIPAAPAKQIFGERMLVVGDAAGMVDPVTAGGILHAINGGKLAGEVCANALERNIFSSMFLSQYQTAWHKTIDHFYIYSKYLLSDIFLNTLKLDKNAYSKLFLITQGEFKNAFNNLGYLLKCNFRQLLHK